MIRGMLLAAMLAWASGASANDFWDSLWHNADQRGEQLMRQGNAAAAARTYADPQHKAFAELQAGDYQRAAQDFSAFDDSTSNYNRGNALAHAGQLQDAIKAYDAALVRDPKNRDARHNRDLVMQALKKQPPPPPPKPAPNKNAGSGKDNKNSQNQSGSNKDANKQNGSGQPSSPNANSKLGKGDQHNNAGPNQDSGKNGQTGTQSQQQQGQPQSASAHPSNPGGQPQGQPQPAPAQALNEAAGSPGKPMTGQRALSADAPVSEKKLAQEQWLRSIPDDPGGLLRRKFMIEHMIRQQER